MTKRLSNKIVSSSSAKLAANGFYKDLVHLTANVAGQEAVFLTLPNAYKQIQYQFERNTGDPLFKAFKEGAAYHDTLHGAYMALGFHAFHAFGAMSPGENAPKIELDRVLKEGI